MNTSSDQFDPEAGPIWRERFRSLAQIFLLASLSFFWLASLSLMALTTRPYGIGVFVTTFLLALVFLVMSIACGVLARQWLYIYILVGIISIPVFLLALSTPVILRPRGGSNESAAVANLRTINTAEVTYLSSSGDAYGAMTDLIAAGLLDDTFAGTKAGYNYSLTVDAAGYTAIALPASTKTGRYSYYSVPDAVVRYSMDASLAPAGQSGRSVQ